MKKISVLILMILMPLYSIGQRVTLADLSGTEVGIILDIDANNDFTDYYVFQYETPIFNVLHATNISFIQATRDLVKVRYSGNIYTFTIDPTYVNSSETVYYGFGLSKKKGAFQLVVPATPIYTLMEAISYNRNMFNDLTCHSGGEGSSECSTESLSASCSVKCNTGYYACCDDTKNECRCKEIKEKKKKVLSISPN